MQHTLNKYAILTVINDLIKFTYLLYLKGVELIQIITKKW